MKTAFENSNLDGVLTLTEAESHILNTDSTDQVSVGFEYDRVNPFEAVAVGDDHNLCDLIGQRLGLADPIVKFKYQTTINGLYEVFRKKSIVAPPACMIVELELGDPETVGAEYQLPFFGTQFPNELAFVAVKFSVQGPELKRDYIPRRAKAAVKGNKYYRTPEVKSGEPQSFTTEGDLRGRHAFRGKLGTRQT